MLELMTLQPRVHDLHHQATSTIELKLIPYDFSTKAVEVVELRLHAAGNTDHYFLQFCTHHLNIKRLIVRTRRLMQRLVAAIRNSSLSTSNQDSRNLER
ncbi:hypothetical protein TNCV_1546231 [Trichonephila clavipes]|nr:hypothetical protein TNCV_1546231 [Trichonephila clavipes]